VLHRRHAAHSGHVSGVMQTLVEYELKSATGGVILISSVLVFLLNVKRTITRLSGQLFVSRAGRMSVQ
jgi:hypothetical protein